LKKLNNLFKKYSPLIQFTGLIIALVMIYSLKLETEALELSQKEYFNSLKPTWTHRLNYSKNNTGLTSITFSSVNESIQIQNLEIFFPNDFPFKEGLIKTYDNQWKCLTLSKKLEQLVKGSYDLSHTKYYTSLRSEDCYPIAIKFNYVQYGEAKTNIGVYNINFTIFNKGKVRIRSLEYKNSIDLSVEQLRNFLNNLNCLTCLQNLDCIQLTEWDKYKAKDERLLPLVENIDVALPKRTVNLVTVDQKGETIKSENIVLPLFLTDDEIYKSFEANLDVISELRIEGLDIKAIMQPIKTFFIEHQLCEPGKYQCMKKNGWVNEKTIYDWQVINIAAMLEILRWYKAEELTKKTAL
jgi:hypothetical protein